MKNKKHFQLLYLLAISFCLTGCASKNYLTADPLVFDSNEPVIPEELVINRYNWDNYDYLLNFSGILYDKMEKEWESDRMVFPYGPYLLEWKKVNGTFSFHLLARNR
ncbi:hypothetical protein M2459_000562 [Parabacteroides sp. PF5-5]|uniref:hypothetical protein n=1 Tax=unclassified Parabacteroides TaxID=2649774 RepID=UPI0024766CDF|nr:MULTISPECIES: hypothetical protein [unclassified Parabacteroides]MDH6303505.1 hypothetical protein [Parabacteroides sp. PH5-39]MDH6314827.1 hypothetical protein [Parabacteroides sp. PF5-13]MDH6318164.1 hypothetical protein [Parabacteroides sp. PH5-13]MDH6321904.1 hypothetical protein [Parabacteroides sp. PH5-8]MDH6326028.1 hypothetical protein [Parabacteroides sp. PH5-41]